MGSTPYLLSTEIDPGGYAVQVYDMGVTQRVNVVIPVEALHLIADSQLTTTLSRLDGVQRPPTAKRGQAM